MLQVCHLKLQLSGLTDRAASTAQLEREMRNNSQEVARLRQDVFVVHTGTTVVDA